MGDPPRLRLPGVEVDFGTGLRRLPPSAGVLDLRPRDGELTPAVGPVDWSQLDAFPQCRTLEWSGPERGIIAAVAGRPGIRFLYWDNAAGDIDLSATHLGTVRLEGADLQSVLLPHSIQTLLLRRPPAALRVRAPDLGHGLDLRLFQYGPDVVIPEGVRRTRTLWLWVGGDVSATVLTGLTDLQELRLTFGDPPGVLTDPGALGQLRRLHTLEVDDAYGLDLAELPEMPALRSLFLNGTRRTIATAAGARYKGTGVELTVHGAKSQAWLAAHMDNPFRDWVQESKPFGKAACAAYTRALRAIDAIQSQAPDRLVPAERALRGLVADLNAINDKYGLIDTNYREQAGQAFYELAKRLHLTQSQADLWFDDGRRF